MAEQQQHHPDLHITSYRDVAVELYTHSLGGITVNDIIMAKLFDLNIKIKYSNKWLKDHPKIAELVKDKK